MTWTWWSTPICTIATGFIQQQGISAWAQILGRCFTPMLKLDLKQALVVILLIVLLDLKNSNTKLNSIGF